MEHVKFAYIEQGNFDGALRMFNTLNTSGRPLSDQDIIKSTLYFKLKDDQYIAEALFDYWGENSGQGESLEDSLSIYSNLFQYATDSKKEPISVRKFFTDIEMREKDPKEIFKNIKKIGFIKDEFINQNAVLGHWFQALNTLWFSRACCIAYIFRNSDFSEDEKSLCLHNGITIENIVNIIHSGIRHVWLGRAGWKSPRIIQRELGGIAGRIMNRESPDWTEIDITEHQFREYLESPTFLRAKNLKKDILILYNLLNSEQQKEGKLLSSWFFGTTDLEHILPQKHELWNSWGEDEEGTPYKDIYVDHLGNLTMLEKGLNRSVSNNYFAKKRESYSKSFLVDVNSLNDIVSEETWNPESCDKRYQDICDRLCKFLFSK